MAVSPEFSEYLRDLFAPLGPVGIRRMFGGGGVFRGDAMFALVADDVLYLKTDEGLAAALEAEGSAPFTYEARGRQMSLGFWRMPDAALDDPDAALDWARRALVPAEAAAAGKRAAKARKSAREASRSGRRGGTRG